IKRHTRNLIQPSILDPEDAVTPQEKAQDTTTRSWRILSRATSSGDSREPIFVVESSAAENTDPQYSVRHVRLANILSWVSTAELARFENEQFVREQALEDSLPNSSKRGRPKKSLLVKKALGSSSENDSVAPGQEDEPLPMPLPRVVAQKKRGRPSKQAKFLEVTESISSRQASVNSEDLASVSPPAFATNPRKRQSSPDLAIKQKQRRRPEARGERTRRHGKGTEFLSLPSVKKRVHGSPLLPADLPPEMRQMPDSSILRATIRTEIPSAEELLHSQKRSESSSDELQSLGGQFRSYQDLESYDLTLSEASRHIQNDLHTANSPQSISSSSAQSIAEGGSASLQNPHIRLQNPLQHYPAPAEHTDESNSMLGSPVRLQRRSESKEPIIEARKANTKSSSESTSSMTNTPARHQRATFRSSTHSHGDGRRARDPISIAYHEAYPRIEPRRAPVIQLDSEESTDSSNETDPDERQRRLQLTPRDDQHRFKLIDQSTTASRPRSALKRRPQAGNPFQEYTSNALPLHPDTESESEGYVVQANASSSSNNLVSHRRTPTSTEFTTQPRSKAATPKGARKSMTPLFPRSAILLGSGIDPS
ncbi:MAG: hypothetical protein Q9191_004059, partial [Dirinaria sp. TL-2023a]